jgi:hypothetical protein
VAIALALAACGADALPRQAPRERSSDAPVATRAPLGGLFTVIRGEVVEDHLLAGIVGLEASERFAVAVPVEGRVHGGPPPVGAPVQRGDVLFEVEPTMEVRLAATELEAALAALARGSGPQDELEARVVEAEAAATGLGLPVDESAAEPLPDAIGVTAPVTGTVIATHRVDADGPVPQGFVVVDVGVEAVPVVQAELNGQLSVVTGIGATVTLAGPGAGAESPAGEVVAIEAAEGGVTLTVVLEPGPAAEAVTPATGVTITWSDERRTDATVLALDVADDTATRVTLAATIDVLGFEPDVELVSRSGEVATGGGTVHSVLLDGDGDQQLVISMDPDAFDLGTEVRIAITGAVARDVLWLAPDALRSESGVVFVIVTGADGPHRVEIQTGLVSDDRVAVIGALRAGDEVIGP